MLNVTLTPDEIISFGGLSYEYISIRLSTLGFEGLVLCNVRIHLRGARRENDNKGGMKLTAHYVGFKHVSLTYWDL